MSDAKKSTETVWINVPLDLETRKRLRGLAKFCQADDTEVAASLLHDILRDDEQENVRSAMAVSTATFQ